ncbi:MAG: TIGR00153 family protein [Bacillota bacterium]|nr:TIGR00153 family protein [Bacillota bacterium]
MNRISVKAKEVFMFKKGKKVIDLIDRHYNLVLGCFNSFVSFTESFFSSGASEKTMELCNSVDMLEREADAARRGIVDSFLDGAMLSQTRREVLQIVEAVDKVANKCQGIAWHLIYEKVEFPDEIKPSISEILSITKEQLDKLTTALNTLFDDDDSLVGDSDVLHEIKKLESNVDEFEIRAIKTIFKSDRQLALKNHLKEFISRIADISDIIEDISDEIQVIVVFRKV